MNHDQIFWGFLISVVSGLFINGWYLNYKLGIIKKEHDIMWNAAVKKIENALQNGHKKD